MLHSIPSKSETCYFDTLASFLYAGSPILIFLHFLIDFLHSLAINVTGYVVIPLTKENLRAVAMEDDSLGEVEVDAYLSGSVVKALTKKSDNQDTDISSTLNQTNVEIQAGCEDFKVRCQNIGTGPDGVLRMSVLDNGEVITSLQNHIDSSYSTSDIINSSMESVYEDNSENILNIASESIQGAQFLGNAVAEGAFVGTIQTTNVQNSKENVFFANPQNTWTASDNSHHLSDSLTTSKDTIDILKDLELTKYKEQSIDGEDLEHFFSPDFETLIFNKEMFEDGEPAVAGNKNSPVTSNTCSNEYIDIADFAFLLKSEDDSHKNGDHRVVKCECHCNLVNKKGEKCACTVVATTTVTTATNTTSTQSSNSIPFSKELKQVLATCSQSEAKNTPGNTCNTKDGNKIDLDKSCCVTVCLNTLKQLRKVLEQRCCMAGKTIV